MKIKYTIATCFGILLTSLLGMVSSTNAKPIISGSTYQNLSHITNAKPIISGSTYQNLSHITIAQLQQRIRYESVNAAFKGKYKDIFIWKSQGRWVEYDENGKKILWNEIIRNDEYVMLFNPKSGVHVRLQDEIYFFKTSPGERWLGYTGKWIK